jgi:molecular chaperone GrpE (heat shock protein)
MSDERLLLDFLPALDSIEHQINSANNAEGPSMDLFPQISGKSKAEGSDEF